MSTAPRTPATPTAPAPAAAAPAVAASAAAPALPPKPTPTGGPANTWPHRQLYDDVIGALYALPGRFHSPLVIEGVLATDLHTMNTALGAAIEQSVVDSLNELRSLWDPNNAYAKYSFVRQSQTLPDVLLRTTDPNATPRILMGIELKGWFAIAKEAEPSARFYAGEHACADADLLVVIPWLFDSVVSGKPRLMKPIIAEAKHVARVRNWWWEFVRESKDPPERRGIVPAPHQGIYPAKTDKYSDRAISDGGKNFGRVARCGVIDDEIDAVAQELALGIPVHAWRRFLSVFSEKADYESMQAALTLIESGYKKHFTVAPEYADRIAAKCHEIADIIQEGATAVRAAPATSTGRRRRNGNGTTAAAALEALDATAAQSTGTDDTADPQADPA